MRPRLDGSQTSAGRAALNASMICANSTSVMSHASTALRDTLRLVALRPVALRAFQIAPLEPPSPRLKRTISRCRWHTQRSSRGAPPARRFNRLITGKERPSDAVLTRTMSIARAIFYEHANGHSEKGVGAHENGHGSGTQQGDRGSGACAERRERLCPGDAEGAGRHRSHVGRGMGQHEGASLRTWLHEGSGHRLKGNAAVVPKMDAVVKGRYTQTRLSRRRHQRFHLHSLQLCRCPRLYPHPLHWTRESRCKAT